MTSQFQSAYEQTEDKNNSELRTKAPQTRPDECNVPYAHTNTA
jgi:hypothetical protein